ncbi:hypothetical protein OHC33_011297, partial [Knufia fluminis]
QELTPRAPMLHSHTRLPTLPQQTTPCSSGLSYQATMATPTNQLPWPGIACRAPRQELRIVTATPERSSDSFQARYSESSLTAGHFAARQDKIRECTKDYNLNGMTTPLNTQALDVVSADYPFDSNTFNLNGITTSFDCDDSMYNLNGISNGLDVNAYNLSGIGTMYNMLG